MTGLVRITADRTEPVVVPADVAARDIVRHGGGLYTLEEVQRLLETGRPFTLGDHTFTPTTKET